MRLSSLPPRPLSMWLSLSAAVLPMPEAVTRGHPAMRPCGRDASGLPCGMVPLASGVRPSRFQTLSGASPCRITPPSSLP